MNKFKAIAEAFLFERTDEKFSTLSDDDIIKEVRALHKKSSYAWESIRYMLDEDGTTAGVIDSKHAAEDLLACAINILNKINLLKNRQGSADE